MASGFDAAIKPGQRSPKYAQVAFKYERLHQEKMHSLVQLEAKANPEEVSATDVLNLLNDPEQKLTAIRTEEPLACCSKPGRSWAARSPIASSAPG